jgi:hypothetical protein
MDHSHGISLALLSIESFYARIEEVRIMDVIQFLKFCAYCFTGFHVLRFIVITLVVLVTVITRKEEKRYLRAKLAYETEKVGLK